MPVRFLAPDASPNKRSRRNRWSGIREIRHRPPKEPHNFHIARFERTNSQRSPKAYPVSHPRAKFSPNAVEIRFKLPEAHNMPRQGGCCNSTGDRDEGRRQGGCCNDSRRSTRRDGRSKHRDILYLSRSIRQLKAIQCTILAVYFGYSVTSTRPGQALIPILVRTIETGTWPGAPLILADILDPSHYS